MRCDGGGPAGVVEGALEKYERVGVLRLGVKGECLGRLGELEVWLKGQDILPACDVGIGLRGGCLIRWTNVSRTASRLCREAGWRVKAWATLVVQL